MYIYIQCSYQQWCLEDILLPSIKIWLCVCSPSRSKKYKSKPNILVGIIQPVKSTIWCRFKTLAGHKTICQLLYFYVWAAIFTHTLKTGIPADRTFSVSWFHSKLYQHLHPLLPQNTWLLNHVLGRETPMYHHHWTTFFWFSVKYQSAMLHNNLICLASNLVKTHLLLQRTKGHHQMQTQSKWNWHLNSQLACFFFKQWTNWL